ncbi:hypothetical protein GUITHDRAFT_133815 [Guillardia theta CCMP2712]|uniref:Uncharacterized protein n=1 Tax=Guillardia theta (strain CCMP2712) TaxID=905079 RepID=L1JUH8_GUITC|nr:hypothetical protein GUITHDRAFT_133815 [Guillardia theta CCMP2712]EKX52072.1 hypothetical protein GUITHDRAFT_133815 [Guillardia theta CCMP2712]|eukprot:XP_005839052.1 hypothetical protein GUITHDRAFT_133815 [Guillardia theta CCMP2712]
MEIVKLLCSKRQVILAAIKNEKGSDSGSGYVILFCWFIIANLREYALAEAARDAATFARGCRQAVKEIRLKIRPGDPDSFKRVQEMYQEVSDLRIVNALNACNDTRMICKTYQSKQEKQINISKKRNSNSLSDQGSCAGNEACEEKDQEDFQKNKKIPRNRMSEEQRNQKLAAKEASWSDFLWFANNCLAKRPGARIHTSLLMIAFQAHFAHGGRQGGEISLGVLGQFLNQWDASIGGTSHGGWYSNLSLSYIMMCG